MKKIIFQKKGHKYFVDDIDTVCVSRILAVGGFSDFSKVRRNVLEASQFKGTAIHKTTELFDLKTLEESKLAQGNVLYLAGWKKFLKDYGFSFKPKEIEQPLYSKMWGFCGTPDRNPIIEKTIIDIKTGGIYPATALQMAAYQILVEENYGIKIKHRLGVQLIPNDYKVTEYKDSSDRSVFIGAVVGYHFKKKHNLLKKEK